MSEIDTSMCLSIVMPCFNEQQFISECVNKVLASPFVGQLIIVDDGSTDGTRDLLRQLTDPRVEVYFNETNMGKGSSLARGFEHATRPFVLVQDADLEYDPDEYGMLLGPLLKNKADVVFGSRFTGSGPHRVLYFWHYIANKILTLLSNAFTNLNLTDMETCYKCFRLEVIQSIQLNEKRFGIEPELTSKISKGNWRVYEVGISYSGRTYDEGKKIGLKDAFRAVYCILKYR
jgi:glycosyltransferase involved in cell wall biosynthesis